MGVKIVIEGIEEIIKRDLKKHQMLLERNDCEMTEYKNALSYQLKKLKHYDLLLKGENKYNKDSLSKSIDMIEVDIKQIENKIKLTNDAMEHNTLIVNTLTKQLEEQMEALKYLYKQNGTTN